MEGFEIGAMVDYHSEIGGPVTKRNCRIRSGPWKLGSGAWVIKITGVAGGVSLDALTIPQMETPPDCKTCKYVRPVQGDVHKKCVNKNAHVEGAELGIKKGYFMWPFNFDPRWLVKCDGYVKRGK